MALHHAMTSELVEEIPEGRTDVIIMHDMIRDLGRSICETREIESLYRGRRLRRVSAQKLQAVWESLFPKLNFYDILPQQSRVSIRNLFDDSLPQQSTDRKEAIMRLEFSRNRRRRGSFVTIPRICRFWESDGHNFDIKSLDPTKMTQETYDTLVDIIEFIEISRLLKLFLRAIMLCFIAIQIFLGLMVESYDSKAKIQEIKAKIQDKFNYDGNCNVKIGIIPERSGTPFLKMGVLRPTPMVQKVNSTQLVLRLTGAKHISREYDITSIVSKLSTSEFIVLLREFLTKISTSACSLSDGATHPESTFWML